MNFIITSELPGSLINEKAYAALEVMARRLDVPLLVVPARYGVSKEFVKVNPGRMKDIETGVYKVLLENLPVATSPTVPAPTGDHHLIVPHPTFTTNSRPTTPGTKPYHSFGTGTISRPVFRPSVQSHNLSAYYAYGGLLVYEGKPYQLEFVGDSVQFMDVVAHSDGRVTRGKIKGLAVGDTHVGSHHPETIEALFGAGGLVELYQVDSVFLHDMLDFNNQNPHHTSWLQQVGKILTESFEVKKEIEALVRFHNKYLVNPGTSYYYVDSNHHDMLMRWVNTFDFRKDPVNAPFFFKLVSRMMEAAAVVNGVWRVPNPLKFCMESGVVNRDSVHFLFAGTPFMMNGRLLNHHGDKGVNGARGSLAGFGNALLRVVVGHMHSFGIYKTAVALGCSTELNMGYNMNGFSTWDRVSYMFYGNGGGSLIFTDGVAGA